jgi:(2Fe-2S) ferredoxin
MVIYPEGVWYTYHNREDIDEILQTHVVEGGRVERLLLTPDQEASASVPPQTADA